MIHITAAEGKYYFSEVATLASGQSTSVDEKIMTLSQLEGLKDAYQTGRLIMSPEDYTKLLTVIRDRQSGKASYPSFTGNAAKVLAVNATEDDVEWTTDVTQVYVDTQDSLLQDQIDLKANTTDVNEALDLKANTTAVSQALALKADAVVVNESLDLKADLIGGLIPSSQLPSYVDDVLNFPNLVSFPSLGESGKIYIAEDVNKTYRWAGSSYVEIGDGGVALGETSSTAYRGDRGKIAYDHSLSQGNPHNTTTSDINEGTKLFFTESRVNQTVLTGLNTSTATPALATDQLLAAIGKLQAQINNIAPPTWVSAASIGTVHPNLLGSMEFAKINGLLWIRGYCNNVAYMGAGTTLFLLTDPSYHLDIPYTAVSPNTLGEIKTFRYEAGSKLIELKNVVNNANKFSLHNSSIFYAGEYNHIQPVALGKLITP